MKRTSTVFLQAVIVLIGTVALAILIWFPLTEGRATNLELFSIYFKVFTSNSIKTLKSIKYCAIVLSILIVTAGIYIKIFHSKEDDPAGFLVICIVTTFVSIIVATAAAIFEKILQNAIDMKLINDLTI